uniref:Uncharacterized protein n=1 Tax=Medicago truncatula TaxID=3880 RepID=I3T2C0_MEDTR|nr:unknown [Medicago truncatula]
MNASVSYDGHKFSSTTLQDWVVISKQCNRSRYLWNNLIQHRNN